MAEMQYTDLGKTGLKVSVAGLGCGGEAQLGLGRGKSEAEAISLVRAAMDLGVNFFDTSEAYLTETILGQAVTPADRDKVVLESKSRYRDMKSGELHPVSKILEHFENSLTKMKTDHLDVYMIHGVLPQHYEHVRDNILPALLKEKEKGKIGHVGLSEFPAMDPEHQTMQKALNDAEWEVMMFGFHMLHQGPAATIFPRAQAQGVGTAIMYAVRSIFSRPGAVDEAFAEAVKDGELTAEQAVANPLDFLIHEGGATSLQDAAYRFARHQPGANVIMFGTSSEKHLRDNINSLLKPALPEADVAKLRASYSHLRAMGLDIPDALKAQMGKK